MAGGDGDAVEDDGFDDEWWDRLAIDAVTDSQLQAVEAQAEAVGAAAPPHGPAPPKTEPHDTGLEADLVQQVCELRALQGHQEKLIQELRRCTQQQKGEISVVRANWSRAEQQNTVLQQQHGTREAEYRQRLERMQQENVRHLEKLETAAAFRRIEQDTSRTAWPSTLRRRPAVLIDAKKTPSQEHHLAATPTRRGRSRTTASPSSPQAGSPSILSPLSLTRRKRAAPADAEPASPSRGRAVRPKKEFPGFVNSFADAAPAVSAQPAQAPVRPPTPQLRTPSRARIARDLSPTPSPEQVRMYEDVEATGTDATTLALTLLFCRRTRWITHVMSHPHRTFLPPAHIPGTAYLALGAGLHPWSNVADKLGGVAECGARHARGDAGGAEGEAREEDARRPRDALLLHLASMRLPEGAADEVCARFEHAVSQLWACVVQGSSYDVFVGECAPLVGAVLEEVHGDVRAAVDDVWEQQSEDLYGTVAAALRTIAGIFARMNLVHYVCDMLSWMAALGISHPAFCVFLAKRFRLLPWVPETVPRADAPDGQECVPSSQDSVSLVAAGPPPRRALPTPVQFTALLAECVRKCHAAPLHVCAPETQPQRAADAGAAQGTAARDTVWDIGPARDDVLRCVLQLLAVLSWTLGTRGFHYIQPFLQTPGMVLSLLDSNVCPPRMLLRTVHLLSTVVPDPLTLHVALSSQYDHSLQTRVPMRLQQAQFPVIDVLAKHLVDRRGDAVPRHVGECGGTAYTQTHELHCAVLSFLSYAARHRDTCLVIIESLPLLAALVQCMAWDTHVVWNGGEDAASGAGLERGAADCNGRSEHDGRPDRDGRPEHNGGPAHDAPPSEDPRANPLARALERICRCTRLLYQLYGAEARNLAEKLLSPSAQAMLNGIRYAFIVAMGRIAFACEPEWLVRLPGGAQRTRLQSQLENTAALAGEMVEMVLSPGETDEIYELLAEEADAGEA
ncbi:hypothetical protein MSPP1_001293 [Malassezia sp. CBS 17886]|nr:hypothetical protein MSPP1_001293 [Malassezia sp. CBS 17886]